MWRRQEDAVDRGNCGTLHRDGPHLWGPVTSPLLDKVVRNLWAVYFAVSPWVAEIPAGRRVRRCGGMRCNRAHI